MAILTDTIINGNLKVTNLITPTINTIVYLDDTQFLNSWVNYIIPQYGYASYWKDSMGIVHMAGAIRNGTIGQIAFYLQFGYRPLKAHLFCVLSYDHIGRVTIYSDGGVHVDVPSTNEWVSLFEVSFRAEQ